MSDSDNERVPAVFPNRFWTEYEPDPEDPSQQVEVDYVEWIKKGDRTGATTQERVRALKEKRDVHGRIIRPAAPVWAALEKYYEGWKRAETVTPDGIPLAAWPGATPQLVDALKKINIYSVEDFATAPPQAFQNLQVGELRSKQKNAIAFLEAAQGRQQLANELASRDAKIAAQDRDIADLKAQIATLVAERATAA